jgi:hypothetical protein
MSTNTAASRWWLALDGKPDGPRTAAYITAALQTGTVSLMTPACPEGDCRWQPLGTWPELADVVRTSRSSVAPPPPPSTPGGAISTTGDRLITNPLLPQMGNLICIYAIVVAPLYWILSVAYMIAAGDNPFLEETGWYLGYFLWELLDTVVALGLVVLCVFGGIGLRMLDRASVRTLMIAFSCRLAWCLIYVVGVTAIVVIGAAQGAAEDSESSAIGAVVGFFFLILALALTALEIVNLVWLIRCRRNLPLH